MGAAYARMAGKSDLLAGGEDPDLLGAAVEIPDSGTTATTEKPLEDVVHLIRPGAAIDRVGAAGG